MGNVFSGSFLSSPGPEGILVPLSSVHEAHGEVALRQLGQGLFTGLRDLCLTRPAVGSPPAVQQDAQPKFGVTWPDLPAGRLSPKRMSTQALSRSLATVAFINVVIVPHFLCSISL